MPQRIISLDILKGLGILFIVLGHIFGAGVHLTGGISQTVCTLGYKYLYAFHVPLFFAVAGMTFKRQDFGVFFKKRFTRLLVPYFVFACVAAVIYYFTMSHARALLNASATTSFYQNKAAIMPFWKLFANIFLGGFFENGFVGYHALWFIPALFTVELFAQLIARMESLRINKTFLWLGATVACVSARFLVTPPLPLPRLPWEIDLIPSYFPYFVLGMAIGLPKARLDKKTWLPISICALIAFGTLAILNPYQYHWKMPWQLAYSMFLAAGNIAAWFLLSRMISSKWLSTCGVWSLGIMLTHKYPMLAIQNGFAPVRGLFGAGLWQMILAFVTVFAITMLCSLFACRCGIRLLPWAFGAARSPRQKNS